ncbi:MAG: hypothetical protein QXU32_06665 [Nitrososphaerales archaeon]
MSSSNIVLIVTAENKAGQVLQQVQQEANKTQQAIANENEKVALTAHKLNVNALQAAAGFAAVTASAVSLGTSLSNLEKAKLRVETAQKNIIVAQATAKETQLAYNRAVEKFGPDSEQAQKSLLRLQAAQQQVEIAQQKAKLAQDQMSDTYANFIASLAPQIISMTFGIQSAFRALGITSVSQLIPAVHGVGSALRAAFLSPPPVGLIIAGAATVVALLTTNAGGLRDAIVKLGEQIFQFIQQHLRPLADLLTFLNNSVIKPLAEVLGITAVQAAAEAENAFNDLEKETTSLGLGIGLMTDQINKELIPALDPALTSKTNAVNEVLKGTQAIVQRNIELYGAIGRTAIENAGRMFEASTVTVTGLSAIEKTLIRIQELQGTKISTGPELFGFSATTPPGARFSPEQSMTDLLARSSSAREKLEAAEAHNLAVDEEIGRLTRMAQSLMLATGQVSPVALFGAGVQLSGGLGGTIALSRTGSQLVTEFGTFISRISGAPINLLSLGGNTVTLAQAIQMGLGLNRLDVNAALNLLNRQSNTIRDFRTLSREEFFSLVKAQYGFEGFVDRPTLFLAGEAGSEHVKITPNANRRALSLVLEIDGRAFAEAIVDDIDQLITAKTVPMKIKARGLRLT